MGSNLLEKADSFEKLATLIDLKTAIANLKPAIQSEIAGGIRACNHLMTSNPKAANSKAIQELDEVFGKLGGLISQLTESYLEPFKSIKDIISSAYFYTSPQNTGTGYDALTNLGGAVSPAAYLNRINAHVNSLEKVIKPIPTFIPAKQVSKNIS